MAEQKFNLSRRRRAQRALNIFNRAIWLKWSRYTISGLIVILLGILLIGFGLLFNNGSATTEALAIGFGAIIVLIGIVRMLIGFINPAIPSDLRPLEDNTPKQDVADVVFEPGPNEDNV